MVKAIIKKYWKILLSMAVVCTLGIGILTGLSGSCISLRKSLDRYLKEYGYPDAVITTEVTYRTKAEELLKVEGIQSVDARAAGNAVILAPNGRMLTVRAFSFGENDHQKFVFWEKSDETFENGIYMERDFARDNRIRTGDEIHAWIEDEKRPYRVQAIVSMPEDLATSFDSHTTFLNSDFGYVYVPDALLKEEPNEYYDDTAEQIREKEQKLDTAEEEAKSFYLDAIHGIDTLEEELNQKISEFSQKSSEMNRLLQEAGIKKEELTAKRQELVNNRRKLQEKEAEVLAIEADLLDKEGQLEAMEKSIRDALKEADRAETKLLRKQKELNEKKEEVLKQREELAEALSKLREAKEGLQKIDEGLADAEAAEKRLNDKALVQAIAMMRKIEYDFSVDTVSSAAEIILAFVDLCRECGIEIDIDQPLSGMVQDLVRLMKQIRDDEKILNDPSTPELVRKAIDGDQEVISSREYAEIRSAVSHYVPEALNLGSEAEGVISEEVYQKALTRVTKLSELIETGNFREIIEEIAKCTDWTLRFALEEMTKLPEYAKELSDETGMEVTTLKEMVTAYDEAMEKVISTIRELNRLRDEIIEQLEKEGISEDGIDEAIEKAESGVAEIDEGLRKIDDGLQMIRKALGFIKSKRAEAGDGLRQIDAFLDQIADGLRQVAEGKEEIAGYYKQIEEGFLQIDDGLGQIQDAEAEITGGLKEAQKQIEDGRKKIEDSRREAEDEWAKTLLEFADLRKEIESAREELGEFEGYQSLANQFLITFEEGADPDATLSRAEEALKDTVIKDSYTYENSGVKNRIDSNLDPVQDLSYFTPVIFYAVIMLVTFLFMSLLVRQCRREIGILRAIGFSRNEIRKTFCVIGAGVALAAFPAGILTGYVIIWLILNYFKNFFNMPSAVYHFDPLMVVLALAATVLAVEISTLIGTFLINRIQPAEAMSRRMSFDPGVPDALSRLTGKMNELTKFSIVSILRNKLRFVFTVLCVAASVAMIISSFSFIASKNYVAKQIVSDRIHYDARVYFTQSPDENKIRALNALPYVKDAEMMTVHYRDVTFGPNTLSLQINSLPAETTLISIFDERNRPIQVMENGIVLDRYSAEQLGASIGDTVMVEGVPLEITALSDQCADREQYVSRSTASKLGKETIGAVLLLFDADHESDLAEYLRRQDGYLYTFYTVVFIRSLNKINATYDLYAWTLIWFSILIGFVIVSNITQTNLLEQKKEICVLRTLGFTRGELSWNMFKQSLLQFLASIAIGLPAGVVIAKHALKLVSTQDRFFKYANGPLEFILTAMITLLYIVISHLVAMNVVHKWNLPENIKEKE